MNLPRNRDSTSGDDEMAVFSIIKVSELEGAKMLAPEFYHPVKILSKQYLEKSGKKRIKDHFYNVREIFDPKNKSLPQQAIVFDLSDVTSYFLYGGKKVTSSEEVGSAKKIFSQNDVLISRLRPYLKEVSFVGFNEKLKLASTEFVVLRQKYNGYYPETLFAYLISKEVQNLLAWSVAGTEHPRFNEDYFLSLTLPIFSNEFQNRIKRVIQTAWKIFLDSSDLYSQAENLLLEELKLKDFKSRYVKTYTAQLSDVSSAHRADAEYFQPAYEMLVDKLNKNNNIEIKQLKEFISGIQKGVEPGSENYQDKGKPFIRVSNISINGFINRDQKYLSAELYQQLREAYEPKQGDFLLTKDATPGIALVVKEPIEGLISSGILKLQIDENKIKKEYLALYINSFIGKMLIEKDGGGSVILHWKPAQVKLLNIPILPLSIQQNIASLVQESHNARRKAKESLEIAKKAIEVAIEKKEDEAIRFLDDESKKLR